MSQPIVSVHIPKTGGVTFREILEKLAEGHIHYDYGDRPLSPPALAERVRRRFRRVTVPPETRVVHGHFLAAKYARVFPEAPIVVWLRQPLQRLSSHYNYIVPPEKCKLGEQVIEWGRRREVQCFV